jgi:hypothetical protein
MRWAFLALTHASWTRPQNRVLARLRFPEKQSAPGESSRE